MRYAYEKPDGTIIWHEQGLSDGPPPVSLDLGDVEARRCYRVERLGDFSKGWPMVCVASGVSAEDAQKLRDEFRKAGVPTEVTSGGDPIYTSAAHRKRALRARGLFDRAAYY